MLISSFFFLFARETKAFFFAIKSRFLMDEAGLLGSLSEVGLSVGEVQKCTQFSQALFVVLFAIINAMKVLNF